MKVTKNETKGFQPFELTIKVETENEAIGLCFISQLTAITDTFYKVYGLDLEDLRKCLKDYYRGDHVANLAEMIAKHPSLLFYMVDPKDCLNYVFENYCIKD